MKALRQTLVCNPEIDWCECLPRLILLARRRLCRPKFPLRPWLVFSLLLSFVSGQERIETFSIRFFMGNRKPENIMWRRSCCRVCRLEFTFERQEGLFSRFFFFASKNCTASFLKARISFLYLPVMYYLDFWSPSNELFMFFGEKSEAFRITENNMAGTKQWTPC